MATSPEPSGAQPRTVHPQAFSPFMPHPWIRAGHVQTLLARWSPKEPITVTQGEQPVLVDGGLDRSGFDPGATVRLLAFYTPRQTRGPRRGLVLLLHGWEGSSHSSYNLLLGSRLVQAGYDVVRLNLRDHGPTHHLNRGLFYATLIQEAHLAVQRIAEWARGDPLYLIGPSMGGNFVLRMAIRHARHPVPHLARVIAINPVLDPARTTRALDRTWPYLLYFRRRWLRSLRRKQRLFPDLYDFTELEAIRPMWEMTAWVLARYSPYPDPETYFAAYTVTGSAFQELEVDTYILHTEDDPLIPVDDFYGLEPHPRLRVEIHPSGGHVGYVDLFPLRHCLPDLVLARLEA